MTPSERGAGRVDDVVVGLEPPRRREVKPVLLSELATVDAVLRAHAAAVGRDFTAYRNYVYRVVNLCMAQRRLDPEQLEKVAVAAAFHDLGIWTDGRRRGARSRRG